MLTSNAIEKLRKYFSGQTVRKAYLFGSYSRSDYNNDSDVDLLIEFDSNSNISLIQFSRMKLDIEKMLNRKTDILTVDAISPYIAPYIQNDKIIIHEKTD